MSRLKPRTGMPDVRLDFPEFSRRYREQFRDPAYEPHQGAIDALEQVAFEAYKAGRKAPRTRPAGDEFEDPSYELSLDWLATRKALRDAAAEREARQGESEVLLINGSPRNEHTCAGEMSKSWRLLELVRAELLQSRDVSVRVLDLSRTTAEYGRRIHPCKACFSTAPLLCHFPCSCYPNYALDQVGDWMNEIYPMWTSADGVLIVTPVHWFQSPMPLKAMIDRLVCADGGNPDPTRTHGKDARRAQQLELEGWSYPKHLAGRMFALVVHGDTDGADAVRHALSDWLETMGLEAAGSKAVLSRYVGYYQPYAKSHEALDADHDFQEEARNTARVLVQALRLERAGKRSAANPGVDEPRPK